ncbi:hypothetical protein V5N11_034474 [Cardamine amara subsp. amara]|uniref:Uncharacterized protein n=1 Tax=Cardamine amara subsp. amara TaxID=228776 RepID=A0ABD1BHH0_CARAN
MNLAGRRAADVMNEATEALGQDECQGIYKTTPECLKPIIGYTCKFQIKLTTFSFRATRQTITVSRFLETNIDVETIPAPENLNPGEKECVIVVNIGDPKEKLESTSSDDLAREKKDKRHRLNN